MKNKIPLKITVLLLLFLVRPGSMAAFQEPEANVNARYTVEGVELSGVAESRISKTLHEDMEKLVGEKFNQETADQIAKRIRKELPDFTIKTKVRRGDQPDCVKVIFEAERYWWKKFDLERSRIVYQSKEGWSGEFSATLSKASIQPSGGATTSACVGRLAGSLGSLRCLSGFRWEIR